MKRQVKLRIILATIIGVLVLLISQCNNNANKEITNVDKFTRYYESTDEESGGFEIMSSNYITFEKTYLLSEGTKEDQTDKKESTKKQTYEIPTFSTYTVKSGDSLSKIAESHGIGLSILRANNPKIGRVLKVGDKMEIPTSNGIFYKVKSGDSLFKIAQKYRVKSSDITKYNKLASNNLRIGQNLYLHNPTISSTGSTSSTRSTNSFRMPVAYKGVTSPFGRRMHPVLKRYIYHKGVDLRAHYTNMYASRSGRVSYAGWMSGYGKLIIIKHSGGYETRYAHLNNIYVKVGQNVNQGALIGKTGMTGRVTGPHLHFEIRKNNNPLDPMKHLAK